MLAPSPMIAKPRAARESRGRIVAETERGPWLIPASGVDPVFRRHSRTRGRMIALGFVPDRRFVLVVFSYNKRRKAVRVITAYEPTEPEWRIKYEALKK